MLRGTAPLGAVGAAAGGAAYRNCTVEPCSTKPFCGTPSMSVSVLFRLSVAVIVKKAVEGG